MDAIQARVPTNAERHARLAGEWLASHTSTNTIRSYRRDLHELFAFLDTHDVDALTAKRSHLDAWRLSLDAAPATVARKLAAVSSFYRYATYNGAVPANPAALVRRPRIDQDHSTTQGLTRHQSRHLLDAARMHSPRSHALITVLLFTGARITEVLNARISDLQHDAGHRVLVVTRKGGKRGKLVLPAQAVDALATYLGQTVAQGTELATDTDTPNPPIFTTATGRPWAASEAFRTVRRLARAAGIEGRISPHSLRHTHATLALDAGVSLADLQDSLGQADPRTTRRYDRARGRLERSSSYAVATALG